VNKGIFTFILFTSIALNTSWLQAAIPDIYEVIQSDDSSAINAALSALEKSPAKEKDAYRGALLMKKSGMMKSGMDKFSVFKQGRKLLEASIKQDSSNAEYRFLRLMIQEQAPDFLNYHSKKEEDAKMIRASYQTLPSNTREAIKMYSKKSRILKPEEFQK
jgi:hypothetical protein